MTKKEKQLLSILSCDFHYKKNIKKFMKFYDFSLSDSLDYIFDVFFTELNKKVALTKLNKEFSSLEPENHPRCNFSLKHHLTKNI